MRIITIHIKKGGVGKTSFCFNFSKHLAKKSRILLIDGDSSCNLTMSLSPDPEQKKSVFDVFNDGTFEIEKVGKNLDLIKGSPQLTDDSLNIRQRENFRLLLFMWIADNNELLNKNYDYIIIDTHNDDSIVTSNFLAVADMVLGISEPSRNGYRAWIELQDTIDYLKKNVVEPISRRSYIIAEPYLIGNNVSHVGNTAREFTDLISQDERFIGIVPQKELIRRSLVLDKSINEQREEMSPRELEKQKPFFDHMDELFQSIIDKLD